MTKSELLKYIDTMLTQRSDGNIGLLMVRQYVEDNMKEGTWELGEVVNVFNGETRKARRCSECGAGFFRYDLINTEEFTPNFCPKCGAEMKGEEE